MFFWHRVEYKYDPEKGPTFIYPLDLRERFQKVLFTPVDESETVACHVVVSRIMGREFRTMQTVSPVFSTAAAQSRTCGACGKHGAAKVRNVSGFRFLGLGSRF